MLTIHQKANREVVDPAGFYEESGGAPTPEANHGLGLAEVMNTLARRKYVILTCIVVITSAIGGWVWSLPREYAAETMITIESRKTKITDLQAVTPALNPQREQITTEAAVLQAPELAERVVRRLNLIDRAEFNPSLAEDKTWLTGLIPESLLTAVGLDRLGFQQAPANETPTDPIPAATRTLQGRLEVMSDGRSFVLTLRARSRDPILAAQIADGFASEYLEEQSTQKEQVTERSNVWLRDRLGELRNQVIAADQAVAKFREEHHLADPRGVSLINQQLSDLNTQLTVAASERTQKEAGVSQVRAALGSPDGVSAAAQVLASPLIQRLSEQESDLQRRQAALSSKFLPGHPAMIDLQAEIANLHKNVMREIDKILASLSNEAAAARTREATLRKRIADLVEASNRENTDGVQLKELERDAAASKALYEEFLTRFKQVSAQGGGEQPDARIVSRARVPVSPSFPRRGMMLALALVGSAIFGAALAFLLEHLDTRVRSERQAEEVTGVPAVGLVPAVRQSDPVDVIVREPHSLYSEAIRNIGAALQVQHGVGTVILVTSSVPQEGKSVFACSLARSMAESGARVLLIDGDLRRPMATRLLGGVPSRGGLCEAIRGELGRNDVLMIDEATGLEHMPVGHATQTPQHVLSSVACDGLFSHLRTQYDFVVLDAPPVLPVSDALIMERLADVTLFVVRWGATPRALVQSAFRKLRRNVKSHLCVVLSRVDLRKHASYGFGDVGYAARPMDGRYRRPEHRHARRAAS